MYSLILPNTTLSLLFTKLIIIFVSFEASPLSSLTTPAHSQYQGVVYQSQCLTPVRSQSFITPVRSQSNINMRPVVPSIFLS
jgi:hypothetical protein